MDVRREVLRGVHVPLKLRMAHAGGGRAGAIVRPDNLVPGAFVKRAYRPLHARIPHYQKAPALHVAATRRARTGLEDFSDQVVGDWIQFQSHASTGQFG
jgi:hypothetical protein